MRSLFKRIIFGLTLIISPAVHAGAEEEKTDYLPNIHGTIRSRLEVSVSDGYYRFQVRNARVSLDGIIAPTIRYCINTDLCDQGKMKILDAWVRIGITSDLNFQAGQFRMPFGVDPFRAPHTYIFGNRSFIGKPVCNVRAVGAQLSYQQGNSPLTLTAGVFNPTTIGNHTTWHRDIAWAAKATYRIDNVALSTGFQSIIPDSVRANLADMAVTWQAGRWTVESEYMYKHYTRDAHRCCHAYNFWAEYRMPVNAGIFNRMSFQARFDGMTDHSSAMRDSEGRLTTDDPGRNRITAGVTVSHFKNKNLFLDLRANYEKYFYHTGNMAHDVSNDDKALLELVLRF